MSTNNIVYHSNSFDILRYRVKGWEQLSANTKAYLYQLSEACLWGRDIIYLQHHRLGPVVREVLEKLWSREANRTPALEEYLGAVWMHSGIHHSYTEEKLVPKFSREWFRTALAELPYNVSTYLSHAGTSAEELEALIFDPGVDPFRRATGDKQTLLERSSVHFYDPSITTAEAEAYYAKLQGKYSIAPGLNTRLVRAEDGTLMEQVACTGGLYGPALEQIAVHLTAAIDLAPSEEARAVLRKLLEYYENGDPEHFAEYSKMWVTLLEEVDMINGFIETYTDPLGLKGSWEGILELVDRAGTERTRKVINLAEQMERESPIDEAFKRHTVGAMSNRAIQIVMLAGDSYPASPLGINLPNDEKIRAEVGSKSVTLTNISEAVSEARLGQMVPRFYYGEEVRRRIMRYGTITDTVHTDLHEGLGHGSGKLLDGVSGNALREHASAIEEARADLNALYFIAHPQMVEDGILPDKEAYKALYDQYLTRGILTQLTKLGDELILRQAHMQNRALIAWWALELCRKTKAAELRTIEGKHYVIVNDYDELHRVFGVQLAEIQRIKSTGDYAAAQELIRTYATDVDPELHAEVLERMADLEIAPYVGFVNPVIMPTADGGYTITYDEGYFEQNLRYSEQYRSLTPPISTYRMPQETPDGRWHSTLKSLRNQLRRHMDGISSKSMRDKGVDYGINFGVNLLHLRELSKTLPHDAELAALLWHKDVREMKLLALLILPHDAITPELLQAWSTEITELEVAEHFVLELVTPSGYGEPLALTLWSEAPTTAMTRLLPYIILNRLALQQKVSPALVDELQRHVVYDLETAGLDLATYIHRSLSTLAERQPGSRSSLRQIARELVDSQVIDTYPYLVGADLMDLLDELDQ